MGVVRKHEEIRREHEKLTGTTVSGRRIYASGMLPELILKRVNRVVTIYTTRFNIRQLYVLPTQCIYVFSMELRTNSDYFPIQHSLSDFYNRDADT